MTTRRNQRLFEDFRLWEQEMSDFSDALPELLKMMGPMR